MTHDELTKHLQGKFAAEVTDADGYMTMAETAEKAGKEDLARGLYMMAKDEFTHADFIADTMKENGISATKESWEAFEVLKKRVEPLFC